ncbi:MAG: 4,5-DOPA dioxygenase extradiol [Bacteroidota bacterium]|jgi:4,5-DOPA dioxygenase extradiol
MKLNKLEQFSEHFSDSAKMPVLFLGHGSPMNAIEENEFVQGFRNLEKKIPRPNAIVVISAHWETKGTFVTAMQQPKTIHDFGGFPKELFDIQYPASGNPELAKIIQSSVKKTSIDLDQSWGLDHGTWSVVKHLYPKADIPVIQISMDYTQNPKYHYELGKELAFLRNKGILIIGSGNLVHNLGKVAWEKINENFAFDWAIEASEKIKHEIKIGNHSALINYNRLSKSMQLAVPTPEHYLPLLYTLSIQDKNDPIEIFNDKPLAGSLTMTSLKIG